MLTNEQLAVIQHSGDLKVPAFAGSGKSTTLQHYISARPKETILYQCFNKSTREHFLSVTKKHNLSNVTISTAHSIAKRAIYGFEKVELTGAHSLPYLCEVLNPDLRGIHTDYHYVLVYHAQNLVRNFCHSLEKKIQRYDYLASISKDQHGLVSKFYTLIMGMGIQLMKLMHSHAIPVMHDYYLKLFYLNPTQLKFDTILYDEFQDCSPVMASIVGYQKAKKIYVGDPHQLIYGWRGAVDNFQLIPSDSLILSQSFRFGPKIAKLAQGVLGWKSIIFKSSFRSGACVGVGPGKEAGRDSLFLSRGTVNLIKSALRISEQEKAAAISFIGGIHSYLIHDQGYSIYDVINLKEEKYSYIKHPFISSFSSFTQLEDYSKHSDDNTLSGMIELITTYRNKLPFLLRALEKRVVKLGEPVDITFSTAHRAKGLEASTVILSDDFKTLQELTQKKRLGVMSHQDIIESVNILYVAITRASHNLELDEKYMNF